MITLPNFDVFDMSFGRKNTWALTETLIMPLYHWYFTVCLNGYQVYYVCDGIQVVIQLSVKVVTRTTCLWDKGLSSGVIIWRNALYASFSHE